MPFHGVLPRRRRIFAAATPIADIAVNDAAAWRLNPEHRWIYNKLDLTLKQNLLAAPTGVDPREFGIPGSDLVFVRPMLNLHGMGRGAQAVRADAVPAWPGYLWSRYLSGEQSSSDCLVQHGRPLWFAHTIAGERCQQGPPAAWHIGVDRSANEQLLRGFIPEHLPNYTGLCNFEIIDGIIIEAHLRGSNGFFDFYGTSFIPAWVALVDENRWLAPPPPPGGHVLSLFADNPEEIVTIPSDASGLFTGDVRLEWDLQADGRPHANRIAIIRAGDLARGQAARDELKQMLRIDHAADAP